MKTLPPIMVAPNGARRTRADHPALPVSVAELVATGRACHEAGAGALHAHVRDADGAHVLDAGLYRELLDEMARAVPALDVQVTTEAVGRYTPAEQRRLVETLVPRAVSVGYAEMTSDGDAAASRRFYAFAAEAGIAVQHIVYAAPELEALLGAVAAGEVATGESLQLLFVLGRHARDRESDPAELAPFLDTLASAGPTDLAADWAVCAFGRAETRCLREAFRAGGKARVGFENSLWNEDGRVAADNAERVREIVRVRGREGGR